MISALALGALAAASIANAQAGVTATGTMGTTNPPAATMGTTINQNSMARLISLNAIDDFCLFAPPEPNSVIGNTEGEEVAWCIQPRNNARVIPDGTFTSAHFVKTPLYWQIQGWGNFVNINIQSGDQGGELDPHGATGLGNPVGGNVTTNATGTDVSYEEWMNYMAYNQFCLRICISANATYSAATECQHTLDEMGCQWVMPGDYTDNSFTECDGDSAYPPGIYPEGNGQTSTFAQRYTGTYTASGGSTGLFTVGQTVTPQTPYSVPATSNCKTYTSIGNGIKSLQAQVSGAQNSTNSSSASASASTTKVGASIATMGTGASASGSASGSAGAASASGSKSAGMAVYAGPNYGNALAVGFSVVALVAGAGAALL